MMETRRGCGLPICRLDGGGRLFMWSVRAWMADDRHSSERSAAMGVIYRVHGVADAHPHLRILMSALVDADRRPLSVFPPAFPVLGWDETRLLDAVARTVDMREGGAGALLGRWLGDERSRFVAASALDDLARVFTGAGFSFDSNVHVARNEIALASPPEARVPY